MPESEKCGGRLHYQVRLPIACTPFESYRFFNFNFFIFVFSFLSLCVADCLFCVLVLPFNALRFIQGTWTHGDFLCRLVPFIQYGNVGVSLLCIAMITINR